MIRQPLSSVHAGIFLQVGQIQRVTTPHPGEQIEADDGDSGFLESRHQASSYVILAPDPRPIIPALMLCVACTQSI